MVHFQTNVGNMIHFQTHFENTPLAFSKLVWNTNRDNKVRKKNKKMEHLLVQHLTMTSNNLPGCFSFQIII